MPSKTDGAYTGGQFWAKFTADFNGFGVTGYDEFYDGEEHSLLPTRIYPNDTLTFKDGAGNVLATAIVVADGNDVKINNNWMFKNVLDSKENVTVTVKRGSEEMTSNPVNVTVKAVPVTLTTGNAAKIFDGDALTKKDGKVAGWVNNENAPVVTTGTVTDPGTADNKAYIDWDADGATALESNYSVTEDFGTLRVWEQSIDPTDPLPEPGYDPEDVPDPDDPDTPEKEDEYYLGVYVGTPENKVYDGADHKWEPDVKDKDGSALDHKYYSVAYTDDEGNEVTDFKNVTGNIHVTITGQNGYTGTVERDYQITPAPRTVSTPSDSKTYDGTALTAGPVTLTGLKGTDADTVTATATGSQTEVGQSVNGYTIDWNGALSGNYTITENLGTLTVGAVPPVSPLPGNPGGGNGGQTPTPLPTTGTGDDGAAADAAATDDTTATIEDETVPLAAERTIDDNATPMSAGNGQDCWIHWIMILGIIVTVVYAGVVIGRRSKFTGELKNYEDKILGNDENNQ